MSNDPLRINGTRYQFNARRSWEGKAKEVDRKGITKKLGDTDRREGLLKYVVYVFVTILEN